MSVLRRWRKRLRAVLRPRATQRETAFEMAYHIDLETAANIRGGMAPAEARRAALLSFGGIERFREDVQDVRRVGWLDDLLRDMQHGVRTFRRLPAFTTAALLAVALGTGATIAVFSVVHAVLLRDLPYDNPDRLVRIWERNEVEGVERGSVSPGTGVDLRSRSSLLEDVALYYEQRLAFTVGDDVEELNTAAVTPSLFGVLGTAPAMGRTFAEADEDDETAEAVISHDVWQRQFAGAADVLGRTVVMEGLRTLVVVGVMPEDFRFPGSTEIWTREHLPDHVGGAQRRFRFYGAIARLAPAATLTDARAEASAIAGQLAMDYPAAHAGWDVELVTLDDSIVGNARAMLLVMLGLVGCLLLIACMNVASLTVARTTARAQEIALRHALGAGTSRLFRQWLAEGVVIGIAGGLCGMLAAYVITKALVAASPAHIPRLDGVRFNGTVLLFGLGVTCFSALFTGVAPAPHLRSSRIAAALKSSGRGARTDAVRVREWLTGAQVAFTLVLLVCTSLLLSSFLRLRAEDPGFRAERVVSAELRIPMGRFAERRPWGRLAAHYDALLTDIRGVPGVHSAGGITVLPLREELLETGVWRSDAAGATSRRPPTAAADQWRAAMLVVTPGYFETMRIRIKRGRGFTEADRFSYEQLTDPTVDKKTGVAVINEAMARRHFPNDDAIGSTIVIADDQTVRTIVGIVADVRADHRGVAARPAVFLPHAQHPGFRLALVVRGNVPAAVLQRALEDRIRAFDQQISIASVQPLSSVLTESVAEPRFNFLLVACFAFVALALCVTGIFGVVGFLVVRRTREIGIRVALGSSRSSAVLLILRNGIRPIIAGIVVGTAASLAATRGIQALLYGVTATDTRSLIAAELLLIVASLCAALVPALRAARMDAVRAIRDD